PRRPLPSFPTRRSSDLILATATRTPALLADSGLDQHILRSGRSQPIVPAIMAMDTLAGQVMHVPAAMLSQVPTSVIGAEGYFLRSEEHTSELQSRENLV